MITGSQMDIIADVVGIARERGIDIHMFKTPAAVFAGLAAEIRQRAMCAKADLKKLEELKEHWDEDEQWEREANGASTEHDEMPSNGLIAEGAAWPAP